MAYKPLKKLIHPQLWRKPQPNGLVEVVVIDNFGKGPNWYRLWVPNTKHVDDAIKKRMSSDHQIDLQDWSALYSNTSPLDALLQNN